MNTCDRCSANPRTTWKTFAFVTLCLLALPVAAMGQSAPDIAEPGSIEAIAEATTDPSFVSPWVAYVPEAAGVPSPTEYLGRIAGAPGELTRPEEIFGYLRALAEASPRVHLEEIGRTLEGREILLVAIADEEGIASLDRLKAATAALADPRRTDPQQAEEIIATARPFYYINAGLHADETGPPEAVMELAYRLAVSDQPMIRRIREELVVLINPVSNPDGRAKMADWFYRYLEGRTDFAELPRQSPPYWGRYVFVDMNRDAHQQTQRETQAIYRMFWDYHPAVIHDLHESFALLQTWNGTGPYNPNIDPIVTSAFLEMSFHEVTRMTVARHARRLDLGLRRRLRPPLRRLGRHEPQRHRARLRDLRQRHRRDRRTGSRAPRNDEDLVPAVATQQPARVVDARQRQLHRDRSARHPGLCRRQLLRNAVGFLPHRVQVVAAGRRRQPLRLCHPRGPARPSARRRNGQPAAAAGHRGRHGEDRLHHRRGRLPRRHLCRPSRPALPQLRSRPAVAAELRVRPRRAALRRRVVGPADALRRRDHPRRRPAGARGGPRSADRRRGR